MKQALPVPQKYTLRPTARWLRRQAVLADGKVNRLTMKQALSVPQTLTMPHRQAVLADGAP